MALNDNTPSAPVNQRVLGSSPRGGAKMKIQLMKIGWIFLFKATIGYNYYPYSLYVY